MDQFPWNFNDQNWLVAEIGGGRTVFHRVIGGSSNGLLSLGMRKMKMIGEMGGLSRGAEE